MSDERYWIKLGSGYWREVAQDEFIKAERRAGFSQKCGSGCATGGFSSTIGNVRGRITYGEITIEKYQWDMEFLNDVMRVDAHQQQ